MPHKFESDFAISLRPSETANSTKLGQVGMWTGWERRHWPFSIVRPGVKLYAFDLVNRRLCALLETTKAQGFLYHSKDEFAKEVTRITGWKNIQHDPHWNHIAPGGRIRPAYGIALRWRVLRAVDIKVAALSRRFPQLGWAKLTDSSDDQDPDLADLYLEGSWSLVQHVRIERNAALVADAKAYWRRRMDGTLKCVVCGFDFRGCYGTIGDDFIEMHHDSPLGQSDGPVHSAIADLKPVCSNCHRMIHRRRAQLLSIRQLKRRIHI